MNKEQFRKRLKELDLNLKEFSEISNTSYSTVRNWGFKLTKVAEEEVAIPNWVEPLLCYYEQAVKYEPSFKPNKNISIETNIELLEKPKSTRKLTYSIEDAIKEE